MTAARELLSEEQPPIYQYNANDELSAQRAQMDKRAYHLRRMRFAGVGLLLSAAGLAGIIYNVDLDELEKSGKQKKGVHQLDASPDSNEKFQGRSIHVIGAGEDKRIVAEGEQEIELVETGTSSVPYFPRILHLPSSGSRDAAGITPNTAANPGNVRNEEEYSLVGLGIRTVSIFSIQVYVLGFYVRTTDLSTLQAELIHHINSAASTLVPGEKNELKEHLTDPTKSTEIWEHILRDTNIKSAWRVVPTRNTDFAHLRDGWITGIKKGTQAAAAALKAKSQGAIPAESEYETEEFGASVKNFKDIFTAGGRAPKGSTVMLLRDGAGALDVLFHEPSKTKGMEKLGSVTDPRVGRLIWMGYLAGKNVSSEAARQGVANGCLALSARPVGSVETRVI
ncbi:hypothetical protein MBLNU457_g0188t1 [Dothideomycetes sp. NU457]